MADEIKQSALEQARVQGQAQKASASKAQALKVQQSLAHGWMQSHQQAAGVAHYAKPAQAIRAVRSMPNKALASINSSLAKSQVQTAQAALQPHVARGAISAHTVSGLGDADASLDSIWDLLPYDVAQKILQERGDAIMKSLLEWGEDIRMNAELDKKASMKAQQQREHQQGVEVQRAEVKRSAQSNRKVARLIKATTKLVRALPTSSSIPSETWVRVSDIFDTKENVSPLLAARGSRKAPEPDSPEANENTGVQTRRVLANVST